jgi:hypothetical protein
MQVNSQKYISDDCILYSLAFSKISENVKKYDKKLVIAKQTNVYNTDYFPDILFHTLKRENAVRKLEFQKTGIDITRFESVTNNKSVDCKTSEFRIISNKKYKNKILKKLLYSHTALCSISNIGFYDNYAVIEAIINLSYGRNYVNIYVFKKSKNWDLVYSFIELQ